MNLSRIQKLRALLDGPTIGLILILLVASLLGACTGIESATPLPQAQAAQIEERSANTAPATTSPEPQSASDPASTDKASTDKAAAQETHKGIPVGFTDEGYPYRGRLDAPITMYEYSDYLCPFCNRYFVQTEPALDEAYVRSGQVRVIFRDFPLDQLHPTAPPGHVASLCVAAQGSAAAYWEMHDQLFRTAAQWAKLADAGDFFAQLAQASGVDMSLFNECIASGEKVALVEQSVSQAFELGLSGTPSFRFVREASGESFNLVGAQPFDQFASMIDALVAGETPPSEAEAQSGGEIPFWATVEGLTLDPDRPGYDMAGDQIRGSPDATVVVIEFSDFQCPYCRRHAQETQPLLDETFIDTGKIRWVFKHFPLSIHPQAPMAGVAAECAAEQGKFWEMHHLLFENTPDWSVSDPSPVFNDLAQELALDVDAFTACLGDASIMERVQSDLADGSPFVRGTPTFIVLHDNRGSIIPGALPAEHFAGVIEEILATVSGQ